MSALPQISEAEYEVMKIVWKYAPHIIKCFLLKIQGFSTFYISVNKPQL